MDHTTITSTRTLVHHFLFSNFDFLNKLRIKNLKLKILAGFTLIEMMVVLGIIAIVATTAFYGLSQSNNTQPLVNAQKELLVALRSIQNQVNSGSGGVSVKSVIIPYVSGGTNSYTVVNSYLGPVGAPIIYTTNTLPSGIKMSAAGFTTDVAICFSNPNLPNFGSDQKCVYNINGSSCKWADTGSSSDKVGYICVPGNPYPIASFPTSLTITLVQGATTRSVILEGTGMKINRMYAQ